MNVLGGYDVEELSAGMTARLWKTITDADIVMFAGMSCDMNPLHVSQEYAASTPFGGRIAHGMLSASLISAVLGNKLPGPGTIYMGQTLRFKAPVRIGDDVTAIVTIKEVIVEKKRVVLDTVCMVKGKIVVEGEATMLCTSSSAGVTVPAAVAAMPQPALV
ncbi:MAG: MaoC family dehydratase [Vulcanimicrobiaceae bacterium]